MPEKQMLFFSPLVALLSRRLFLQVSKKKKRILKNPTSRGAQKQTPLPTLLKKDRISPVNSLFLEMQT